MSPASEAYIETEYKNRLGIVAVDAGIATDLKRKVEKVVQLYRSGKIVIFPNVQNIEVTLLEQVDLTALTPKQKRVLDWARGCTISNREERGTT